MEPLETSHHFELAISPGRILRKFTEQEARQLTDRWIEVYAKNSQGTNLKAYLWHTFCSSSHPCISKRDAEQQYAQQVETEVIVLSNDRVSAVLTDTLPTKCNVPDYYVFPSNMAWTMAFTHEDGWLGPYFAKHPNYETLALNNLARIKAQQRKISEIERAKREGWL